MFSQLWFGGIIELVGGVLIAIGLFTRPAAGLASGTMAVAYCFVFLFIACRGPGRVSLDASFGKR